VNTVGLTVTASNESKNYGTTATLAGFTTSGLLNSDSVSSVTLASNGAASTAAAGSYAITPSAAAGSGLANYTITYTPGTLTVNTVGLTVTASNESKNYGTTATLAGFTTSGLLNSDSVSGVTLASNGAASTAAAGSYAITPSAAAGSGLANYTITYTPGTLTVNTVGLTVTASNESKNYGTTATLAGFTTSGLLNGDSVTSVTLASNGAASTAAAGSYAITPSAAAGLGLANYTITYKTGTLAVNTVGLTVTADAQTKVYGGVDPSLTYQVKGLAGGDTAATALSGSLLRASGESVGGYAIAQGTLAASTNYTLSFTGATLTITKAALVVTPENQKATYGSALPVLSGSLTGVVSGDGITASYSTAATSTSTVGGYAITATLSDPNNKLSDYTVTNNSGTLTVSPASLTVTAASATMVYGSALPTLSGSLTGVISGDGITASYSTAATSTSAAGGYAITATLADPNSKLSDYTVTNNSGTLTISQATATPSLTLSSSAAYSGDMVTMSAAVAGVTGAATPTGSVSFYDGSTLLGAVTLQSGSAALSTSSLAVASHTLTFVYSGDVNYKSATSSASKLTVQASALTINGGVSAQSPLSISLEQGGSGSTSFTLGRNGVLTGAVSVTCSGLPEGLSCSLTNATPDASKLPATVTVTVTSTGLRIVGANRSWHPWMLAMLLPGMLLPFGFRRRRAALLLLALTVVLLFGLIGCGGGSSSSSATNSGSVTPAGTYNGTITATNAGAATQTANFTVVLMAK
jgi:hypothetical protein